MLSDSDISIAFQRHRLLSAVAGALVLATCFVFITHEFLLFGPEGRVFSVVLILVLLTGLLGIVGAAYYWLRSSMRDLTKTMEARFRLMSTDALTGALTRSNFLSRLKSAFMEDHKRRFGYIHLDMDNLKVINDTNGHKAGDAALTHMVKMLRDVAPDAFVGRLGGDEFAVLVLDVPSMEVLEKMAEEMLNRLKEPVTLCGLCLELSATIGLAIAPDHGDCLESLLANADLALYVGKESGRGKAVRFEKEMSADESYQRFIQRELRGALLLNELDVHYQPIVDIKGSKIGHYEALLRWQHPVRGSISPAHFIPIAERSTLIDMLGEWVLKRACKDMAQLEAVSINVNVSLVQLRRPEFASRFLAILAEYETSPRAIAIEITETLRLVSNAVEMRNLETLISAGVRVSIDDFGSGATSLDYLRRLRFDAIKIDKSYIDTIVSDPVGMALIATICSIGRALDIRIVAEGVETDEQFRLLQAAGCTHLQGYLFGKPTPIKQAPRFVHGNANQRHRSAA